MSQARCQKLSKRVVMWGQRLDQLGLAHYRVDSVKTTDEPGDNPNSAACVTASKNYDSAHFEFRNQEVNWAYENEDFEYLDQTIIHEWLHVSFQPYYNAIFLVGDGLSADANRLWEEAMEHANEQLIERLARQIYAAFQSDVVV